MSMKSFRWLIIPCGFITGSLFAQTGKVGIGTLTPQAMLHVDSGTVLFNGGFAIPPVPGNPPASGAGVRMMWYPDKAAFRVGAIGVTGSTFWNKDSIGLYSFAAGHNVKAKGNYSVALGEGTQATGNNAFSFGKFSMAKGDFSTAYSFGVANGDYSTAVGATTANAIYGISMGSFTTANGYSGLVVGMHNDPIVTPQTAFGATTPLFIVGNGDNTIGQSNAMVVRKDGHVGLGTNVPAKRLHVSEGASNALITSSSVALFENDGPIHINLITPSVYPGAIYFGNEISATHGAIEYNSGIVIGGLTFRTNNVSRMFLNAIGRLGLGTNTPDALFEAAGDGDQHIRFTSTNANDVGLQFFRTGGGADWHIVDSLGTLYFNRSIDDLLTETEILRLTTNVAPGSDDAVSLGLSNLRWTEIWAVDGTINTSDAREKELINDFDSGLSKVMQLRPVTFFWKNHPIEHRTPRIGFIAQELREVLPEVVITHEWKEETETTPAEWKEVDRLGVRYSEIIPVLTKAIQEQQALIETQQALILDLQTRMAALETKH